MSLKARRYTSCLQTFPLVSLMLFNCPVPGCRHSYSSSAPLRSHLAQASGKAHQDYYDNLYRALNFDLSAATTAIHARQPTSPSTTLFQRASEVEVEEDEEDDGEEDDLDVEGLEVPDSVEDQRDRELVVETVEEEEELDAVAEVMGDLLQELQLASEEELAEYLPVPNLGEEIETPPDSEASPLHRKLVEPPDTRVSDWHSTAGKVEFLDQTALQRWTRLLGNQQDETYRPFDSQIDWELAHWAVKEKIPQGSLDRLLGIPKVRASFVL